MHLGYMRVFYVRKDIVEDRYVLLKPGSGITTARSGRHEVFIYRPTCVVFNFVPRHVSMFSLSFFLSLGRGIKRNFESSLNFYSQRNSRHNFHSLSSSILSDLNCQCSPRSTAPFAVSRGFGKYGNVERAACKSGGFSLSGDL